MTEILLTQGKVALIDDEDFSRIGEFKWFAAKDHHYNRWYACCNVKIDGGQRLIRMHRLILRATKGSQVDHINGNGLDNQKENLRECNSTQNQQNQYSVRGTSKYKGVSCSGNRIQASIVVDGKMVYLGVFKDEEQAARAYNDAATKHFGEFARLNKNL